MKHKKFGTKSTKLDGNLTWNVDGEQVPIAVRLPKDEYLNGFVKVDTDKLLLKSSNGWYWNLYQDKKNKFKLQKLK